MKKLAKFLALVLVVVIFGALTKSIVNVSASIIPNIKYGLLGGITDKIGLPADQAPDVNIKLRDKRQISGVLNLTDSPNSQKLIDPSAPKLCTLFEPDRSAGNPRVSSLYAIGVYSGIANGVENRQPALVGFRTSPGEIIEVPTAGILNYGSVQDPYDVGEHYQAVVVYADTDSIALHYENADGTADGYAVHILNVDVEQSLLDLYNQANAGGRGSLPAVYGNQPIGKALGSEVILSIRDSGDFLDPRWKQEWWAGCDGTNTASAFGTGRNISLGQGQNNANLSYPPLGTLQACPAEIPIDINYTTQRPSSNTTAPPGSRVEPAEDTVPEFYGEPAQCQAELAKGSNADLCNIGDWQSIRRWCYPNTCGAILKANPNQDTVGVVVDKNTGRTEEKLKCGRCGSAISTFCDEGSPTSDPRVIRLCEIYKGDAKPKIVTPMNNQQDLPTCVPTRSSTNRCTTTCGDPLKVNALLQMSRLGTCALGDCTANINISPDTKLYVPLAAKLANYFAGNLDYGGVGDGTISKEELVKIREEVAAGNTDSINQMFAQAGVAKKLLPAEIQDQLRCQFVNYVKDKVAKFPDKTKRENTKYVYTDKDGKITEFKIDDVPASQIQVPPYLDPASCGRLPYDKGAVDEWRQTLSGQAWYGVPLFDNEEAQGAIEFVSASPTTVNPEPIKTSIPEIRRLYNVTRILRKALTPTIPIEEIASATNPLAHAAPTPESLNLTIGPAINPMANLYACSRTRTLEDIYNKFDNDPSKPRYDLEKEVSSYTLGVDCIQNDGVLPKDPTSQSQVCSVGSDGQINCTQVDPSANPGVKEYGVTLQTRNVQPYLFDVFLQTIEKSGGLLRIFKSTALKQGKTEDEFEEAYKPLPAESNKVQFEITQSVRGGVTLDEKSKEKGWMLLFDKLGGVWNARNFVLDLLNPDQEAAGTGGTDVQTPH
ncbi:hypothetical protein A2721_02235 [Candidatus Gottesmanbacteria bacterium RIFCSPHIGHO2_01_FULL_47_48]|uniref:Uncharacterized protein n=1 Tax=Candidatus Gottesmanbacteria bacterium RIFCSPHIGHO2_01_FULL_47_48 TaxID=1798381 RepID=A0A1F5ZZE2_9BACT|nr:MAG: hypothetical protein A2721_02235 [Candidatus Gottesmanbacteria bacterium RIFCSPHIGHO2_01_FULL_47_48]